MPCVRFDKLTALTQVEGKVQQGRKGAPRTQRANPKHEIRNSKQIQMTKKPKFKTGSFGFGVLELIHFGFICLPDCFGFRNSNFGF